MLAVHSCLDWEITEVTPGFRVQPACAYMVTATLQYPVIPHCSSQCASSSRTLSAAGACIASSKASRCDAASAQLLSILRHTHTHTDARERPDLLRLLAPRRPCRLAPLLTLLLTLRLRFLRLTGEGLDPEEVGALALGLAHLPESLESDTAGLDFLPLPTSALSSSLESETAGLTAGLELFFTSDLLESEAAGLALAWGFCLSLGSLSESLRTGLLSLLGVPLLSEGAGLLALTGGCLLSFGPASSESEDDKAFLSGLSALTYMQSRPQCAEKSQSGAARLLQNRARLREMHAVSCNTDWSTL